MSGESTHDTTTTGTDAEGDQDGPDDAQQGQKTADTATDGQDWRALAKQAQDAATKAQGDAERWKGLARKHEGRAKENADAASKAKTVEEQLAELRKAMADRDVADVERNGRLAITRVQTRLAEAGLSRDDMSGLLDLIDPMTLLQDSEPSDVAIEKLARSLTKIAGRTTPDRDQGRRGRGDGPVDMNTLIRRAAGIQT